MRMPKINQANCICFINLLTLLTRQRKPKRKQNIAVVGAVEMFTEKGNSLC